MNMYLGEIGCEHVN